MSSDSGSDSSTSSSESSHSVILQHLNDLPPHSYPSAGRAFCASGQVQQWVHNCRRKVNGNASVSPRGSRLRRYQPHYRGESRLSPCDEEPPASWVTGLSNTEEQYMNVQAPVHGPWRNHGFADRAATGPDNNVRTSAREASIRQVAGEPTQGSNQRTAVGRDRTLSMVSLPLTASALAMFDLLSSNQQSTGGAPVDGLGEHQVRLLSDDVDPDPLQPLAAGLHRGNEHGLEPYQGDRAESRTPH